MSAKVREIVARLADSLGGRTRRAYMVLWLLRGCFGAIIISLALLGFSYVNKNPERLRSRLRCRSSGILMAGLTVVMSDLMVRNKQITTISAVYFGLLLGLLLGIALLRGPGAVSPGSDSAPSAFSRG